MTTMFQLKEARNAKAIELRRFVDTTPAGQWDASKQATYDELMSGVENLDRQIQAQEKILEKFAENEFEQIAADNTKNNDPARAAFFKLLRHGPENMTRDDWAHVRPQNTMSTTTAGEGGYTVPTLVTAAFVDKLKAYSAVRRVATVLPTENGAPLSMPTTDGTAEDGELIAENTTATAADPTFGTAALTAYKYGSKIIAVPFELLQDSAIDIEALVMTRMAQRIGRITNKNFTTGTGSGQPSGIVTGAASGKVGTTGQTATVIYDDLIDLMESIDEAYAEAGTLTFMMPQTIRALVRKLKDDQNMPIFLPSFQMGGINQTDSLLGAPLVVNNNMATAAANAKTIIYGDLSKYVIRDVLGGTLTFRFTDSAYAKLGQVGFLMWSRHGGVLTDTAAVKYYAHSAA